MVCWSGAHNHEKSTLCRVDNRGGDCRDAVTTIERVTLSRVAGGGGNGKPEQTEGGNDMSDLPQAAATHKDFLSVRGERAHHRAQAGIVAEVVA